MSTDRPSAGGGRTRRPVARRFHRRVSVVVVVLAVLAAVGAVVGAHQGPRLRGVAYSSTDLVTQAAQRVILTANQSVEPVRARDVRVVPAAAFTVSTSGNAIAVEFAGPLRYERSYRVTVHGVRAIGQTVSSTLTTTVRTGSTAVLSLLPGTDGAPDRIVRRDLAGARNRVVFRARGIAEFARIGRSLVVLRDDARGRSGIELVPTGGTGPVEQITMPTRVGRASALHVADDGSSFGFVYADTASGQSRDVGLYVVDMAGTHVPAAVRPDGTVAAAATRSGAAGADTVPMTVSQWGYVPRTSSALVRTGTDDLFLIDTTGGRRAVRLGSATFLHGFVGTGTTAVVETGDGIERLDLSSGHTVVLPTPAASARAPFLGRIAALSDDTYLRVVGTLRTDGSIDARLLRVHGAAVARLPVVTGAGASVTGVCPSPNGQFVAVLTRSGDESLVLVVDAASGALEASLAASTTEWCQAVPSGADD